MIAAKPTEITLSFIYHDGIGQEHFLEGYQFFVVSLFAHWHILLNGSEREKGRCIHHLEQPTKKSHQCNSSKRIILL